MSSIEDKLTCPSLRWRYGSTATLLFTGTLAKIFLNVGARADVHGLDGFVKLLDERRDIEGRERGLLTGESDCSVHLGGTYTYDLCIVSNHLSVYGHFIYKKDTEPC